MRNEEEKQDDEELALMPINPLIKGISTYAIGISSIAYILGIVIVNLYLSSYGIYSVELIKAEYMLSGGVFLFYLIFAGLCLHFVRENLTNFNRDKVKDSNKTQRTKKSEYLAIALKVIFAFGLEIIPLAITSGGSIPYNKAITWVAIACIFFIVLLFIRIKQLYEEFILKGSKSTLVHPNQPTAKLEINNYSPPTFFLGTNLLAIFIGLTIYALYIYPYIYGSLGGGDKDQVFLVPSSKGKELFKTLSLPTSNNGAMIGPLKVLTESDSEIVILATNNLEHKDVAIRINKKNIGAIQAIPTTRLTPWDVK